MDGISRKELKRYVDLLVRVCGLGGCEDGGKELQLRGAKAKASVRKANSHSEPGQKTLG